ncbi:MAG: NDP-hexose 2,3-dehydratase family protein [Solobacterium sp.]|nr:NDP-hexose 2,3-dehydratase family protein [Solobacterium sp.]
MAEPKLDFNLELLRSWADRKGNVNTLPEILEWIRERNSRLKVRIEKVDFSYSGFWHYDEEDGYIRNNNNSFFQLAGYQEIEDDRIVAEQPIIIQDEIGYLGILCKMIDGRLNFLMQAKIEPGNSNVIQISPTLQATKSNFSRKHGGKVPNYLDYFLESGSHTVLVDQIQSEQSSRFYKKRNRNMILFVEEEVPILDSHCWMTLGQIKELMKYNNLVNMDTRTVLSCIHFDLNGTTDNEIPSFFKDPSLYESVFRSPDYTKLHSIFNCINDYKMFQREKSRLLPLKSLKGWNMTKDGISCRTPYDFRVIYCRIEIEDREVNYWEQPLIEALGQAVFGIFTCVENGIRKYLVCVRHEIGCFDNAELGPIVQLEPSNPRNQLNAIESLFLKKLEQNEGVITDVILSEEGGRFYHEENRNAIIEIQPEEIGHLPEGYFWLDYATISEMIQFNNCVNIQLRNLFSLIDLN